MKPGSLWWKRLEVPWWLGTSGGYEPQDCACFVVKVLPRGKHRAEWGQAISVEMVISGRLITALMKLPGGLERRSDCHANGA